MLCCDDCCFFFFEAVDGIRVGHVTGVQMCSFPIFGFFFYGFMYMFFFVVPCFYGLFFFVFWFPSGG